MNRESLLRSLTLAPDILEGFLAGLSEELIDRNRGPGFWTIRDHAAHLADVQPMLFGRMESFRDNTHPVMKPYLPEDEDSKARAYADPHETVIRFRLWRDRQTDLLFSLDDAVWNRTGDHPEYERYSLELLAAHTSFHDGFHLYRMEELAYVRDRSLTTLP